MNKPDWELSRYKCGNNRCPIHYYTAFIDCDKCNNVRKLDDWIKPFFDNCCRMEKVGR